MAQVTKEIQCCLSSLRDLGSGQGLGGILSSFTLLSYDFSSHTLLVWADFTRVAEYLTDIHFLDEMLESYVFID